MEASEKKLAAAIGAVSAYIRMEEEIMFHQGSLKNHGRRPLPQGNLWGYAGRQGMMQMRNMMELKTFGRLH